MIKLENINKSYNCDSIQVPVLQDINLSVAPGEIVGIIGRSGTGKSTLLRCVNLLVRPDSGKVIINDLDICNLPPAGLRRARQRMTMIFQHFNLYSNRTVFENIALPLELIRASREEINTKIEPLLELTNLQQHRNNYPASLSGGQKQRVAIARALVTDPEILLCDEMTSALDPHTINDILNLILDINEKLNISILLVTHEMAIIKKIAHRVIVLDKGRIIEQGSVADIFANPECATTKELIQSCMHMVLPDMLEDKLSKVRTSEADALFRITFAGSCASEPVINALCKQYQAKINILQANIENIRDVTIGMLLIAVSASNSEQQQVVNFLREKQLIVEELGYVSPDVFHN